MNKPKNYQILLALLMSILIFNSCSKTEIEAYERESNNKILEYKITNSKQDLFGAIDHQANHITIYIPYYMGIDFLTPTIKLDEGATLVDDQGEEINLDGGIEPIHLGDTVTYTVRGSDQKIRTYTATQQFLPLNKPLTVSYVPTITDQTPITKNVTERFMVYGNFGSTSTAVKYIFTNKKTGKTYDNFVKTLSIAPSETHYSLTAQLEAEAIAGTYQVEIQHQGRRAQLPDMEIKYSLPFPTFFGDKVSYAIGDTILFTPTTFFPTGGEGVYLELDRVYAVFTPEVQFPASFPPSLINTEIEFKVAEQTRRYVKIVVPENMPSGLYKNTNGNNLIFYFDYAPDTNHGTHIRTGVASNTFEITPKAK